jgi:hypothetical protein
MKFSYECICCHIQQILKVAKIVKMDESTKEIVVRETMKYLSEIDYNKTNPEMMSMTWRIILKHTQNQDPYHLVKQDYNQMMLTLYDDLFIRISQDEQAFEKALHLAIEGNVIDYGANLYFSKDDLVERMINACETSLALDEGEKLYTVLKKSEKLMYIGDNCGEIVFDKLFIEVIKGIFPNLNIIFSVRGSVVLNDITYDDAKQIGLDQIVEIIDDGNDFPGLVIEAADGNFRRVYDEADIVIAKGQGNYEGLSQEKNKQIFFLLMAKCEMIAKDLGVQVMDKICKEKKVIDICQ